MLSEIREQMVWAMAKYLCVGKTKSEGYIKSINGIWFWGWGAR